VAAMGAEMGLKVCAIEQHRVGGECLNVGCIPSKALLRSAKTRHTVAGFSGGEPAGSSPPKPVAPFEKIARDLKYINDHKTIGMFKKVELRLGQGAAAFIDPHTVEVGGERISARRIYIAVGTRPRLLPIPGLETVAVLTNENLFQLSQAPQSMVIIGGGAIGCEMAQAFSRLGCRCTIVQADPFLIPNGDPDAGQLLEKVFATEGIEVFNSRRIERIDQQESEVVVRTDRGESLRGERLLMAAGRQFDFQALKLERAGVETAPNGAILVDRYLRTSQKHIFAVGDCNGRWQLSHAAMHQGMIAIMNSLLPWKAKRDFLSYPVPWAVFTEPQISYVGRREQELKEQGVRYETIRVDYGDYGAAIAEDVATGFVKVFVGPAGKIHGVSIVGEGSGEMINEWALAIQNKIRLHDILFQQHAFPTMGFLSKRVAEVWMMKKMGSDTLRKICRWLFRR
ncbi:MAG: NAD(P)/FAD-dependent oxidoreductase, partial [Deltaproteobacteria bacterium]|nr:NAD(P)/FAD-dependent oxidoreductase [Deltaproteobacteria bacterium]